MKRFLLLPTLLMTWMLSTSPAKADEGMWTLYNLPQAVYEQMRAEGFSLPYADLYSSDHAIKNAVVNFSGYCSGVVVSPDGLVFTNHHCGFEAIRSHSTVEHDYMLNGFYARTYADELPNENMFVSFMISQKDITPKIDSMGVLLRPVARQEEMIDSLENAMSRAIKAKDSTLRVEIKPFYEGNKFYATVYRDFTDLRLVFTIPKSMGKFGGDTDNWMWPRQTCDFSVFRIYADPKTNGPAPYSKHNVPYHPATWAKVSLEGYKDGDFAMTMGYPGTTDRYLSSYGIREMRDAVNTPRAQVRGVKQEVMMRHMLADEAVRIKYDSKYAQSANYWKNAIGMNKCIDSIGVIGQKEAYEARIRAWQDSTGYLKGKLNFDLLKRLYQHRFQYKRLSVLARETFSRTNEFCTRALLLENGMKLQGINPKKSYHLFENNSDKWDESLDKEVFATLLGNFAKQVKPENRPAFFKDIEKNYGGDYTKYVDMLYKRSCLMQSGKKIYISKKAYKKDPGVVFSKQLAEYMNNLKAKLRGVTDSINEQERLLCAAKLRMEEDLPHYSDANFTMRLSYGQVGGYTIGGKNSGYYTTAESIVEKMKQGEKNLDYKVEPIMLRLLSGNDFKPYADPVTKQLQLCFLTNNDITGGNSGSPMFNGKGELIGLAFDGNWDSLSNSIFFDTRLGRCIGVDIRFVLFMMDKWGHAERLLKEINAH